MAKILEEAETPLFGNELWDSRAPIVLTPPADVKRRFDSNVREGDVDFIYTRPDGTEVNLGPCFFWTGNTSGKGYGNFSYLGMKRSAHQFAYLWFHKRLDSSQTLDHLCHNRNCVNPIHLEEVPLRVNVQRGNHATKEFCKRGHLLAGDNLVKSRLPHRVCKACERERKRGVSEEETKSCKNGHEWTPDNTYTRIDGRRACRECLAIAERKRYRTRQAARGQIVATYPGVGEMEDGTWECAKGHKVSKALGTEYVTSEGKRVCYVCIKEAVKRGQERGNRMWELRSPQVRKPDKQTKERFMNFLRTSGPPLIVETKREGRIYRKDTGPCWLWGGATGHKGYGLFSLLGAQRRAHEVIWLWVKGDLPKDKELQHLCGRPACVNPGHMRLVTPSGSDQREEGTKTPASQEGVEESLHPEVEKGAEEEIGAGSLTIEEDEAQIIAIVG